MFNNRAKEIIKKVYDAFDADFAMQHIEEMYKLEYGQTFENYEKSSKYVYNLLKEEGFDAQLLTFKADGKTTYQDKRMPIAWKATKGKLTLLSLAEDFDDPVIADFEKMPYALIKHSVATPEGGIRTKIITENQAMDGADCTGALLLLNGRPTNISKYLDLGAIGVISDYLTSAEKHPNDTYWANACADDGGHWHVQSEDRDFIGFMITPSIGKKLRELCEKAPVEVLVECDGVRYEGEINAVTATLKGKSNKEFWIFSHLYEPTPADNSMGVISSVTLLKTIRELVKKGELPELDHTIRVVFAMEVYGFSAAYEALGEQVTNNVLGAINIDGLLEKCYNSFTLIYSPYSTPFFARSFIKGGTELYKEVYPNKEYVQREMIRLIDDTFLGDSTTNVPTFWLSHCTLGNSSQHNSCVTMDWLDKDLLKRHVSVLAFVAIASICKVIPIEDMLENALYWANVEIERRKEINDSEAYLSYFRRGEKKIILDFKKISNSPLIEEYANKIDDTYVEYDGEMGEWQAKAKLVVAKRETKGLPFDRINAPKSDRKRIPDGVLYGPFGLVLSAMDGKQDLEKLVREAYWEDFREIPSDETFKTALEAVYYLEKYGYLRVEEKSV